MNELVCRTDSCENVVSCEPEVSGITCSTCCALIGTSYDPNSCD